MIPTARYAVGQRQADATDAVSPRAARRPESVGFVTGPGMSMTQQQTPGAGSSDEPRGPRGADPPLGRLAGMGMELAGGIIGFLLLGWLIGWACGASRTGLIVGAVIGCVGGLYNFIRQAMLIHKTEQRRWAQRHTPRREEGPDVDRERGE